MSFIEEDCDSGLELSQFLESLSLTDEETLDFLEYAFNDKEEKFSKDTKMQELTGRLFHLVPAPGNLGIRWKQVEAVLETKLRGPYKCRVCGGPLQGDVCELQVSKWWLGRLPETILQNFLESFPVFEPEVSESISFVAEENHENEKTDEEIVAFAYECAMSQKKNPSNATFVAFPSRATVANL